jgi:hypothetical protein
MRNVLSSSLDALSMFAFGFNHLPARRSSTFAALGEPTKQFAELYARKPLIFSRTCIAFVG